MNYALIATGVLASGAAYLSMKSPPGLQRNSYHLGLSMGTTIGGAAVLSFLLGFDF